ncbi:hypothetical protein LOAG_15055 [Loa loa]|uniref:Aldehyde dehydrogenase domain-containing protein n=1 Tax=Loa loa TaxID=7209 RepID=A0A1S0TGL9_LOALO|nr:hypothetical protein LOAG_15055 [Loa loa]EFO13474.1 hypothetical protein LOAG_15055 [Loa loa]
MREEFCKGSSWRHRCPLALSIMFETEEEVLALANHCRTGLAGYIFTTDYAQILRVSRSLQVGIIGVNEGMVSCAEAAFGGIKESGLGREGGSQGIDEFSQWKYVCVGF